MKLWDRLPTVISCCFCCFLRAGTVMIGLFSFTIGVIFAPNVSQTPGFWDLEGVLSNYSTATEGAVQMIIGVVSIMLCCVSVLLLVGALCVAIFAPNVSQTPGFWDLEGVLSNYSAATEGAVQMIIGVASIMLCCVSVLLLVGALCNLPILIEVYQWGAALYTSVVVILYLILAVFCFFVHTNCYVAGGLLLLLIVCSVLLTIYFILVANSLRISLQFLNSTDIHDLTGSC